MKLLVTALVFLLITDSPAFAAEQSDKAAAAAQSYKNIQVDEFDKLRANQEAVILDVRTAREFAAGHMPKAINIDWYAKDFEERILKLDKSKTYLVHCASGGRSASAGGKMAGLNFKSVYNLLGGFRAWERAGKPVEKGEAE